MAYNTNAEELDLKTEQQYFLDGIMQTEAIHHRQSNLKLYLTIILIQDSHMMHC